MNENGDRNLLVFTEIIKFIENGVPIKEKDDLALKCVRDGNLVLESNFLVRFGRVVSTSNVIIVVKGLCLQYSHRREEPFEITTQINLESRNIEYAKCTCVAGALGKCKHSVGLLFQIAKFNNVDDLPTWSCTDQPCAWAKDKHNKAAVEAALEPKPLLQLCHPKKRTTMVYDLPLIPDYYKSEECEILMEGFQSSALWKHLEGRNTTDLYQTEVVPERSHIQMDQQQDSFLNMCFNSRSSVFPDHNGIHDLVNSLENTEKQFYNAHIVINEEKCNELAHMI